MHEAKDGGRKKLSCVRCVHRGEFWVDPSIGTVRSSAGLPLHTLRLESKHWALSKGSGMSEILTAFPEISEILLVFLSFFLYPFLPSSNKYIVGNNPFLRQNFLHDFVGARYLHPFPDQISCTD